MSDTPDNQIRWTIMLYLAADGDLANFAVESLKQLNHSAGTPGDACDPAKVVVAAQFAVDAPGGHQIPRYIFNECSGGSLRQSLAGYLNAPDNMTEQQALISFLQWVCAHPKCEADKYALILWGHGPELLLQPPSAQQLDDAGSSQSHSLYLTPEELRVALEEGVPENKNLSIIGFDACSMSMFEVAYEIRELAEYMVASQEEVPDLSFPYDTLVSLFRKMGDDEEGLLRKGVYAYVNAYQDYICNSLTKMKRATLSALRLSRCGDLEKAIQSLASALREAKDDPSLPSLLIEARVCSRDFAAGLYVDLVDFSTKLVSLLSVGESEHALNYDSSCQAEEGRGAAKQVPWRSKIKSACQKIINALAEESADEAKKSLVLANCSADPRGHGVSLYLPYLCDEQYGEIGQPTVKGGYGTLGGKEFSVVLNRAGSGLLMSARRELIIDTEGYYEDLELAFDTGWYRFIVEQWSRILVENAPEELDLRYSAQQCAVNTCRTGVKIRMPSPPKRT